MKSTPEIVTLIPIPNRDREFYRLNPEEQSNRQVAELARGKQMIELIESIFPGKKISADEYRTGFGLIDFPSKSYANVIFETLGGGYGKRVLRITYKWGYGAGHSFWRAVQIKRENGVETIDLAKLRNAAQEIAAEFERRAQWEKDSAEAAAEQEALEIQQFAAQRAKLERAGITMDLIENEREGRIFLGEGKHSTQMRIRADRADLLVTHYGTNSIDIKPDFVPEFVALFRRMNGAKTVL